MLLLTVITAMSGQKKTIAQQSIRAISVWCSSVYDVVIGLYVPQGLFDSTYLWALHGAEELEMCCGILLEGNALCMRGISLISAQMHKIPEYYFLLMWTWPLHEPDLNLLAFFVFCHIVIFTFTKLKFYP
jgi:hypothetical protein